MKLRLALILLLPHIACAEDSPALVSVYTSGQEGYHTYRIPALVVTNRDTLLAFCEGRKTSRSDHGDVDLVLRRSLDNGKTWSSSTLVHEEGGSKKITIGNPCPVVDQMTGRIWLPLTRDNDDVLLTWSDDDGLTWSTPRVITESVKRPDWTWYATGPGNGIQLERGPHKGRLIIPCDHRIASIKDRRASTRSHVIYSDDHGQSWKIGGITDFRMNECAIIERTNGELLLNMRSNRGLQCRATTVSKDGGLSWSECRNDTALPEPVCQASLVRHSWPADGQPGRLLFCNPSDPTSRKQLTLRISLNEGQTWAQRHVIYSGAAAYSSVAVLGDGQVGVLFEKDGYKSIAFAKLDL